MDNRELLAYIGAALILAFMAFVLCRMWASWEARDGWREFEQKVLTPLSPDEYAAQTPEQHRQRERDWNTYKQARNAK